MVASESILHTTQRCFDWSKVNTVSRETLEVIFGVTVAGIRDEHWNHIQAAYYKGRPSAMKQLARLRDQTLGNSGIVPTEDLADMMSNLRCSDEPARINSSASSSSEPLPPFLRASQPLVHSQIRFNVSSQLILVKKQESGPTGSTDSWLADIQEEFGYEDV